MLNTLSLGKAVTSLGAVLTLETQTGLSRKTSPSKFQSSKHVLKHDSPIIIAFWCASSNKSTCTVQYWQVVLYWCHHPLGFHPMKTSIYPMKKNHVPWHHNNPHVLCRSWWPTSQGQRLAWAPWGLGASLPACAQARWWNLSAAAWIKTAWDWSEPRCTGTD